ncbi:MAG: type II toxin-antitoxin system RelE/ParE family toxin [Treponema sp.]|nr:type II toxin-antitoxin system RelE/ParE family toxin [Treponema sp.]
MKKIKRSDIFIKWLKKLRDHKGKAIIHTRIDRLASGNPGDHKFLGDISEMRIDFGPGYRVYYEETSNEIILLLSGGDKSTQQKDIEKPEK